MKNVIVFGTGRTLVAEMVVGGGGGIISFLDSNFVKLVGIIICNLDFTLFDS